MIAFQIYVNDQYVCTAGVGDLGVLSAILTWVRRGPQNSRDGMSFEEELTIDVGGLSGGVSSDWLRRKLAVGDAVTVRVISADTVDKPSTTERSDLKLAEKNERKYFERLKKKYDSKKRSAKKSSKLKAKPRG